MRHFVYPYGVRSARGIAGAVTRYGTASSAHPAVVSTASAVPDVPRIDAHDLRVALALGLARSPALPAYLTVRRRRRGARRRVERLRA